MERILKLPLMHVCFIAPCMTELGLPVRVGSPAESCVCYDLSTRVTVYRRQVDTEKGRASKKHTGGLLNMLALTTLPTTDPQTSRFRITRPRDGCHNPAVGFAVLILRCMNLTCLYVYAILRKHHRSLTGVDTTQSFIVESAIASLPVATMIRGLIKVTCPLEVWLYTL